MKGGGEGGGGGMRRRGIVVRDGEVRMAGIRNGEGTSKL